MRIIIAPDSYKGTITSIEACEIIADAFLEVFPDAEILQLPMADGGEGTTDAIVRALKGEKVEARVRGPLWSKEIAYYGFLNDGHTAVMEMSAASGINLVPHDRLNPLNTTTYGTGQLIRTIIEESGVDEIIIGIGGSATVDGGAGMAEALGYRLLDSDGKPVLRGGGHLSEIVEIDDAGVIPGLKHVHIKVASDVNNPLLGPNGAAAVYGSQKGATDVMIPVLEDGLRNLMDLWKFNGMISEEMPGDGAAGGLGAGLRAFCNAETTSGAKLICDTVGLDKHLDGASLLITGEGKTDFQTMCGKLCSVIAGYAKEKGVPVMLISGVLEARDELFELFDYALSSTEGYESHQEMLENAKKDLRFAALNAAKMLKGKLEA